MQMKLPGFCYQKAFWIIVPLLVIATSSGIAAINAEINGIDDRLRAAEVTIANDDVPELKSVVKGIDEKVDAMLISQARLEGKIEQLLP
jgi:hypothetical protein